MPKTLLTTHDVTYATSAQTLFSNVSITIKEKNRIGLIGKNGTGKTTFLKLLSGILEPDSGTVIKNRPVGYVPQITNESSQHIKIKELLLSAQCSYVQFCNTYSRIFSSTVPSEVLEVDEMSGGERTKLWIVLIATQDPSILLLDEPTNHLDQKSINELKRWIDRFNGAVVLVSHNQSFLFETVGVIWALDEHNITVFGMGYKDYLREKLHDSDARARQYEATKKELALLEKGVRMRVTKSDRTAKVQRKSRGESSRSKSADNYFKNRSEKGVGKIKKKHDAQRSNIEESLQCLRSDSNKAINLPLNSRSRKGGLIIDVKTMSVSVGLQALIQDVELRIEYGDRLSIQGNNGVGKTLLVKKIVQEIHAPTPDISNVGTDVQVSYIDQQYEMVDKNLTVFENIEQHIKINDSELIYKQIGRFQFPEQYVRKKVNELSGGEIARLAFAIATAKPLDLLILDEPTNNLDIETVNIILDALNDFQGSLVVVTHDKSFLEGLRIQTSYRIKNGTLSKF